MLIVEFHQVGFGLSVSDRQETAWAYGLVRVIAIASVQKNRRAYISHNVPLTVSQCTKRIFPPSIRERPDNHPFDNCAPFSHTVRITERIRPQS
jgi:hypothetical protein